MKTETWEARTYDEPRRRLVPCYEAFYGTAAELVAQLAPSRPRLLDLGAGTGLMSAAIGDRVPIGSLTLLDGSARMLAQARERLAAFHPLTVEADLRDALPEGPFDVVVSALAVHHLDDPEKRRLYARVFERLAPGGFLVNAEQIRPADPAVAKLFESTHLQSARRLGSDEAEIAAAVDRMKSDRCCAADQQVRWLAEIGFDLTAVYYQWFNFAVFAGCKPKLKAR